MGALGSLALAGTPFFFLTDFLGTHVEVFTLDALKEANIAFDFSATPTKPHNQKLTATPIDIKTYETKFDRVIDAIKAGETYVLNLTQPTVIESQYALEEIYNKAQAPFKIRYKDRFVCFSPEPFVTIKDDTIHTFPMKGTIDASLPHAYETLLKDPKELAEHVMIVDLLRNDLSQVARDVKVTRFRFIEPIRAGEKTLLHASSHIQGTLPHDWRAHLDEIIAKLLPAGSISGAPKKSTVSLIQSIEGYDRGYFTGIMGHFDGAMLSTAVMIRFIEKTPQGLVYKSGGGITLDSTAKSEYQEMLDKIYIP